MTHDQEKLMERLARAIEAAYANPRKMITLSVLSGVAKGVGATVGTAIVLSLIGLILQWIGVFDDVRAWINSARF